MTVLFSFASVAAVSLVSLAGVATLAWSRVRVRRLARLFVSFAVGALLGDAFIHLIPQTFTAKEPGTSPLGRSLLILGGMLGFFVVEKVLRRRHGALHEHHHQVRHPELVAVNLLGDAIHNFVDGVLIGASYIAGPTLGVATTLAVLLHEVPQELGDFGILIHSGLSIRKAVWLNLASASAAILGTAVALAVGSMAKDALVGSLLPVTAGGFVYLAAADLIPELQHDRTTRALFVQTSLIASGIGIMGLLALVE